MSEYFNNFEELKNFVYQKTEGSLLVTYRNLQDYEGMVLGIGIIFNTRKGKFELNLEWISFGLDLYAENLMESYLYKFDSLRSLISYLELNYNINDSQIPKSYKIDNDQFPNPIKDKDQEAVFKQSWNKFQKDFEKGSFLDTSLHLVYASTK